MSDQSPNKQQIEKLAIASKKYDNLQGFIITLKQISDTLLKVFRSEYEELKANKKDILALDTKLRPEKIIKFVHEKIDLLFDDYDHEISGDFFHELANLKARYAKDIKSGKVATVVQKLLIAYDNSIALHGKLIKEHEATLKFINKKSAEIEGMLKNQVDDVINGLNSMMNEFEDYVKRQIDLQNNELEKAQDLVCTGPACKAKKAIDHDDSSALVLSSIDLYDDWNHSVDL